MRIKDAVEGDFNLWRDEIITTEELTLRIDNRIADPTLKAEAFEHIQAIDEGLVPYVG